MFATARAISFIGVSISSKICFNVSVRSSWAMTLLDTRSALERPEGAGPGSSDTYYHPPMPKLGVQAFISSQDHSWYIYRGETNKPSFSAVSASFCTSFSHSKISVNSWPESDKTDLRIRAKFGNSKCAITKLLSIARCPLRTSSAKTQLPPGRAEIIQYRDVQFDEGVAQLRRGLKLSFRIKLLVNITSKHNTHQTIQTIKYHSYVLHISSSNLCQEVSTCSSAVQSWALYYL